MDNNLCRFGYAGEFHQRKLLYCYLPGINLFLVGGMKAKGHPGLFGRRLMKANVSLSNISKAPLACYYS